MIQKEFSLKIGLFGIGLDAYWDQFAGLRGKIGILSFNCF